MHREGRLVPAGDTQLFVVEAGPAGGDPILILHGGPGLDHHEFGDYLDPLSERGYRLLFVDQRAQGRSAPCDPSTWTLQKMAEDVLLVARSLGLDRYATLGHSFGAFVVLQNAVDFPGMAAQTIVSSGLPSSRFLGAVEENLRSFEPEDLREQVAASWEQETEVETPGELLQLIIDQMPFHFADPLDPRIEEYVGWLRQGVYAPEVLRRFAASEYGGIEVEDRLGEIPRPVLVLAGRRDRTCILEGAEVMAKAIPGAELVVFDRSAHSAFIEEQDRYIDAVDGFLRSGKA
jgi:proline iminopeptidase